MCDIVEYIPVFVDRLIETFFPLMSPAVDVTASGQCTDKPVRGLVRLWSSYF